MLKRFTSDDRGFDECSTLKMPEARDRPIQPVSAAGGQSAESRTSTQTSGATCSRCWSRGGWHYQGVGLKTVLPWPSHRRLGTGLVGARITSVINVAGCFQVSQLVTEPVLLQLRTCHGLHLNPLRQRAHLAQPLRQPDFANSNPETLVACRLVVRSR